MANILLIDDSDVAGRTMRGLTGRGQHRCEVATSPEEGWRVLRDAVVIDVVFLEMNFAEGAGINLLQRIRDDCFWKNLPVVVYTNVGDPIRVRKALSLKVQNYLIKPFSETLVTAEIDKAVAKAWRNLHFVETTSFCAQVGVSTDGLMKLRKGLIAGLEDTVKIFPELIAQREVRTITHRLAKLSTAAENAGVWAVADIVHEIGIQVAEGRWAVLKNAADSLDYVRRLIFSQMNPHHIPACLRTPVERGDSDEDIERSVWMQADIDTYGPIIPMDEIQRQVAALTGCPVVESAATAFRKAADAHLAKPTEVSELVAGDPGLCAQVLAAANRNSREAIWAVDDPETAVRLLGDVQLAAVGKRLPIVQERHFQVPPVTWANFVAFQLGVAKTAHFICDTMSFAHLVGNAYTAGLLHDIGKLMLLRLHPFSFRAIVTYAREKKIPLQEAERKFIGCTSREMAEWFTQAHHFPEVFTDVIRWVESPELATSNADLTAVVALARHMCIHTRVGYNGEVPAEVRPPLNTLSAWPILEPRVFSGFSLRQFESQTHAFCVRLRHELCPTTPKRV